MKKEDEQQRWSTPFSGEIARYYDLIYHFKDYQGEAEQVEKIIIENKKSEGNKLLEVGCGTGNYLQHLQNSFDCSGLDINKDILAIAAKKLPGLKFYQADMVNMNLEANFDIILCLFNAIAYVKTHERLVTTIQNFSDHLNPGGVIIIEPWVSRKDYESGRPNLLTYTDENLKIARMSVPKVSGNILMLDYHFMFAQKGKSVKHLVERHELGMFDEEELLSTMRDVGLHVFFDSKRLTKNRGIFIANKPIV